MSENDNLVPGPASFYADKIIQLEPEEMEPFYERDSVIRQHRENIARLKQAKAEYDAKLEETIKELQTTVTESLRLIGMMRQKVTAAKARIATCIDKKKNAAHNFHISKHEREIEVRKIYINRREAGKTAKAMANQIFQKMKRSHPVNMKRKLAPPYIPET